MNFKIKIFRKKITLIAYNCLFFKISYFEYHQIWINILMDDRHLNNITKLKKRNIASILLVI